MNPRLILRSKKLLSWAGYPAFYAFCLVLFLYWTFPHERLKARILQEFAASQTDPTPARLELSELSWYGLTGLEAEGVRFVYPEQAGAAAPAGKGKQEGPPAARVFEFSHAYASVSVLRYLFGTLKVGFGLEGLGGALEGSFADSEEERVVTVEIEDMNVGEVSPIVELVGLPLGGTLSGEIDFNLPERALSKANGQVDLTIAGLTVGDGKAKIRNTIALPKLDAGQFALEAEATDGVLQVNTLTADGPDLSLNAQGSIRLRDQLETSILDLGLVFTFKDAYKNKNDMTRGLFGAPGSSIPGAFDLDPQTKRAKGPDGSYSWRVTGTFGRPNLIPDRGRSNTSRQRGMRRPSRTTKKK